MKLLILSLFSLLILLPTNSKVCDQPNPIYDPPYYSQTDPRWANITLGYGPATIGSAGCLLSSVASMIAGSSYHINGTLPTPPDMNTWLLANQGFEDGYGFVWASIGKIGFQLEGFTNDTQKTIDALHSGKRVFLHVMNGHHYVLALGDTGSGFNVMDPMYPGRVYAYDEVVETTIYSHRC